MFLIWNIGPQCSSPYSCSFHGYCWSKIPGYSVFNIARLSSDKKFTLYRQGIIEIKDVPNGYPLSLSQQLQVNTEKNGQSVIDVFQIQHFLQEFRFPLYFLDFETFQPAVPMFEESRPYQQIPFQYSLHVLQENGQLIHEGFLADMNGDPRIPFVEKLISDIGDKGNIIVYNKPFEITRFWQWWKFSTC